MFSRPEAIFSNSNRAHSRRLGVSRLDRTGEAPLVRGAVSKGGGDRLDRLLDAAAGSLLGASAVAHLRQVGTIAGDKAAAVTRRAVARHDDGRVECLQPVEAREPLSTARMGARKDRLKPRGDAILSRQHTIGC